MKPAVSVCMVVKNDEAYLEGCLRSVLPIADEMIIMDRNSTDRTKAIALRFQAAVFPFDRGNNADARNASLKRAAGDWILVIDADERLRKVSPTYLRKLTSDEKKAAYRCRLIVEKGWTSVHALRFFRRDSRIRYTHAFHANIHESLKDLIRTGGFEIGECALTFDHLGYAGDITARLHRNLECLQEETGESSDYITSLRHLALTYFSLGHTEQAEKVWNRCLKIIREKGAYDPGESGPYIDLITYRMSEGKGSSALLDEAMKNFPDNPSLFWLKGKERIASRNYTQAVPFFERLLLWGEQQNFDRSVAHRTAIFGRDAWEGLAAAFFGLKHYGQALDAYEKALAFDPGNKELKVKRDLCRGLNNSGGECTA